MSQPIGRTETIGKKIRVIDNDKFNGLQNQLHRLDQELGVQVGRKVRVFWAGKTEEQTLWEFNSQNVLYYETELKERKLTDSEKKWCNNTFLYRGDSMPKSLYYFDIPKTDELKDAIQKEDLNRIDGLQSNIKDKETRQELVQKFQQKIALNNYRKNQLDFDGYVHNLNPEWNPEHTNEEKQTLKDKARMRADSYKDSWNQVFKLSYFGMKKARYKALNLRESKLSATDPSLKIVELDVIGEKDKNYCRFCGSVRPEKSLIKPKIKGYDNKTIRVCTDCADERREFTDEEVSKAIDRKAVKNGGQRRLHSEFQ
jgi:hypothetical protein